MISDDFVTYEMIAAAFPKGIFWTEHQLRRIGNRMPTSLPFIHESSQKSKPLWRRSDVTKWFKKKYNRRHSDLVVEFEVSLLGESLKKAAAPKKKLGAK